jgi:hypothetical protein
VRVLGLDVEIAFGSALAKTFVRDHAAIQAQVAPIDANCRDLFERMGFSQRVEGFLARGGRQIHAPSVALAE